MIKKQYGRIIAFCIGTGAAFSALDACMTTFINDSGGRIMIHNKNDKSIILIQKNGRRRFGSPHKHAYFDIYTQQPKSQTFRPIYQCKQNTCGKSGNPQIRFSDLGNNSGEAVLFDIIKNDTPHTSMVRELPMIQKKICKPCQAQE
jgi:hypothetical protein